MMIISASGVKVFRVFCLMLIATLLGFYIFQINALVLESFKVQSHQKKMQELSDINKLLEINLTQTKHLQNIDLRSRELGFERINTVHYLQIINTWVAALRQ